MLEYHKIQSIFKRDEKTHKFIMGAYSLPEFEYLANNTWEYTEKIDGTNIRVEWAGGVVTIGGRTANAQIPTFLYTRLQELFPADRFGDLFPDGVTLYGEGYGAKIQKGGGNYIHNGVDFILFDVRIGDYWLRRRDVEDVALKLGIGVVPVVGCGTLAEAIFMVSNGLPSSWGGFLAEGLVLRPEIELQTRSGHRIITKVKHVDF